MEYELKRQDSGRFGRYRRLFHSNCVDVKLFFGRLSQFRVDRFGETLSRGSLESEWPSGSGPYEDCAEASHSIEQPPTRQPDDLVKVAPHVRGGCRPLPTEAYGGHSTTDMMEKYGGIQRRRFFTCVTVALRRRIPWGAWGWRAARRPARRPARPGTASPSRCTTPRCRRRRAGPGPAACRHSDRTTAR